MKLPFVAFLCVWLSIWSFGVVMLLRQIVVSWRAAIRKDSGGPAGSVPKAVALSVFAIPFLGRK